MLHLSSRQFINPAENKFSTRNNLIKLLTIKFISAMKQTENISNQHALRL
jgi:hypothetical protein